MSRMANIGTVYVLLMLRQILKSQTSNKQYMEFVILCFVDKALESFYCLHFVLYWYISFNQMLLPLLRYFTTPRVINTF